MIAELRHEAPLAPKNAIERDSSAPHPELHRIDDFELLVDAGTGFVSFEAVEFVPITKNVMTIIDGRNVLAPMEYAYVPKPVNPLLHPREFRAFLEEVDIRIDHLQSITVLEESLKRQVIATRDATFPEDTEDEIDDTNLAGEYND